MIWDCTLTGMGLVLFTAAQMVLFWMRDYHSADNTSVFWRLLSSACTLPRPSLFPTTPPQSEGLTRVGERLAGDTGGTAGPDWPEG